MNLSSSDHVQYGSEASCDLERAFPQQTPQRTPPVLRRLMPGSWHGENSSSRNVIPGPPLMTPSQSPASNNNKRRSTTTTTTGVGGDGSSKLSSSSSPLVLRKLSPILPLSSPMSRSSSKRQSPNLLTRLNLGRSSSLGSGSTHSHSHITTAPIVEVPTPNLYRLARKGQWEEFSRALSDDYSGGDNNNNNYNNKDIGFIYRKDGTTALHMAVMSITGYLNNFKKSGDSKDTTISIVANNNNNGSNHSNEKQLNAAPIDAVEELLKRNPAMARVKCTLNGYTPLTYACLVVGGDDDYDLEQAAAVVRLILKYNPESIDLYTDDGLSPVDVHIISYSSHHQEKEDVSSRGRTSTVVLRTLLATSPELANSRLRGDKVEGPLELLYKCNSANMFSKAMMEELYANHNNHHNHDDNASTYSDMTLPERRQQVVDTVKKWWIWTWTVMILKYGSLKQKKRGSRFAAVHTAALQIGCPTAIFSLTLYAFPRQIKLPIEDKDDVQNLPLHAVCSWPCHQDYVVSASAARAGTSSSSNNNSNSENNNNNNNNNNSNGVVSIRKSNAISKVLEEYPLAVKTFNAFGESALELALITGTTWEGGIRRLVKAYPKALRFQSQQTGLYPFMTAAVAAVVPKKPSPPTPASSSPGTLSISKRSLSSSPGSLSVSKRSVSSSRRSTSSRSRPSPEPSPSSSSSSSSSRQDLQFLRTIYGLLRSNPKVLTSAWQKKKESQGER